MWCSLAQVGDVIEGTVTSLQVYGAFVQLDESMNGLLHISQISHDRLSSVEQVLSQGMKIKVRMHGRLNRRLQT